MSILDQEYFEFSEFRKLAEEVTAKLNQMNKMQQNMRWQFEDPEWYDPFVAAMQDTTNGWMSSHCF